MLAAEVPALFRTAFDGNPGDGWFDLFVRDGAARLKANEEFRSIWTAEAVARIGYVVGEIAATIERIEETTQKIIQKRDVHSAMLSELRPIVQRAAEEGISEAAVRATVERLGGEGIGRDDLVPWLDEWIEAARRELGKHTNEGEAFEAARREAERRFKAGVADASSAFMEEFEREQEIEGERQEERKRHRLRLLEEAIRFDELAFDGEAATRKLTLMAEVEGVSIPGELGRWLFDKSAEFYERGDEKGDTAALLVAVAAYRAALVEMTRERAPLQWAATQMNLGNALLMIGDRQSGTVRLEEAVAAHRAALKIVTRERVPVHWATTQINLGNAFLALGERESGTARLEEAVAAYRAALKIVTRERVPPQWATIQMNLGNALLTLGERESGTVRLEEAVAAYRAALKEMTRDRLPLQWATNTGNEGIAIMRLAERLSDVGMATTAVEHIGAALEMVRNASPAPSAARYESQLREAQAVLDRLGKR
ncbi:MAG: tetratricopeptide repeat protein [bacterium]|nr:tetratricopeptide repeat protein [bacterium]